MKASEIIAALPKLSRSDLITIELAAKHLIAGGSTDAPDDSRIIYDAITSGLGVMMNFEVFKTTVVYKHWAGRSKIVIDFIEKAFPGVSKTSRTAIVAFLIGALIEDMRDRKVPTTLNTVVLNLSRVPQVFEDAFPGYWGSALTGLILKRMLKREK